MPIWTPIMEWEGQDAFCIGGGPSLLDFDWSLLSGKNTIGCNMAYKQPYDYIKIVIFSDLGFWQKNALELAQRKGRIFCNTPALKNKLSQPNMFWMQREKDGLHENGLGFGGCTGTSAINLALVLGAKRVFLLGYDNKNKEDSSGHRSHYHVHYNGKVTADQSFDRWSKGYEKIAAHLKGEKYKSREVINLNPDSAIECFPKEHYSKYLSHAQYIPA